MFSFAKQITGYSKMEVCMCVDAVASVHGFHFIGAWDYIIILVGGCHFYGWVLYMGEC